MSSGRQAGLPLFLVSVLMGALWGGCKADGFLSANPSRVPVASVAQASFTVYPGVTVNLDGSGSKDLDLQPLTYQWAVISQPNAGSAFTLTGASSSIATFATSYYPLGSGSAYTPPVPTYLGAYIIQLTVIDEYGEKNSKTVSVTVHNLAPTANFSFTSQAAGVVTTLDGTSSVDPNVDARNPMAHSWTIIDAPNGSSWQWDGGSANVVSYVSAPSTNTSVGFLPVSAGVYTIKLVVTDEYGATATKTLVVATSDNTAPQLPSPLAPFPAAISGSGILADPYVITTGTYFLDAGSGPGFVNTESDTLDYSWTVQDFTFGGNLSISIDGAASVSKASGSTIKTQNTAKGDVSDNGKISFQTGSLSSGDGFSLQVSVTDGNLSATKKIYFKIS